MSSKVICFISFVFALSLALTSTTSADLIGWWKFDETSGNIVSDSSGNGNDGTIEGDPQWVTGTIGGAIELDGDGDYIVVPHSDSLDTTDEVTVALWAWASEQRDNDSHQLLCKGSGGSAWFSTYGLQTASQWMSDNLGVTSAHSLVFRGTATPGRGDGFWSDSTMPTAEWTHIAVTFDLNAEGNNRKIYVNGEVVAEDRSDNPLDTNTDNLLIGSDAYSTTRWHWHGMLDDVRIYNTALTEAEIRAVAQGQAHPQASGPNPRDGSMLAAKWANLGWRAGDFAVSHDLYFGTNYDDVNDGAEGTFIANVATTNQVVGFPGFPAPEGLQPGSTYYWRIDEVNDADPNSPWKGDVWSFWIQPDKAYEPDPADGTSFVMTDTILSWTPGFGATLQYVYFGENFDDVSNATGAFPQTDSTFRPAAIEKDKTYYWRIDEFDGLATYKGDVWSFSTIPAIEIGDPNLVLRYMLDEGSGTTALDSSGYDHHAVIGGSPTFVMGIDGGALDLDGRSVYIDMDDRIAEGTFTLTLWLRPRDIPYTSGFYAILHDDQWNAGSCHVHLRNTTSLFNCDINTGTNLSSVTVLQEDNWYHFAVAIDGATGGQGQLYVNGVLEDSQPGGTATAYLGPLNFGAWTNNSRYYHGLMDDIRVYDKVLTAEEVELVMRIDPLRAWQESPANGSTPDVDNATPLSWSPGDNATSHEVYFGTDADAVANADTSDTAGIYRGRQNATTFTPAEGVEWGGGPFYWRVDENNSDGTVTTGRVWSFAVADFLLVDDFEGYTDNDPAGEAIWQHWIDGYGVATNGSQAGYLDPPYAEQTIVNGGRQSMPLIYNNTAGVRNSEVVLPLTAPRNWTAHGVNALSLWYRGYPPSVGSFAEGPAGAITMTAAGADIEGTADQFHFAYKTLTGQGTIIARVDSVQNTHNWAKAGVMIRETLDPDSKNAFLCVTPGNGVSSQQRIDTGAGTSHTNQTGITAPHWVKLERDVAGNFTASHSTNGSSWQPVGSAVPLNIPMTLDVYVGLAVTSHAAASTCEAKFSNVTITGNVTGQWVNQDVGILGNNAEPFYVSISNANGTPAVVVNNDPDAATTVDWTQWVIDLQAFADQGVNLADVDKIALGLGATGDAGALGGMGTLFVDDLTLVRSGGQ